MDYIRLKAADQGFEVIEKDKFSLINERYKKSVKDLAEENGLVALKVEDYNNLIQNANEPALAHISEMATKHEHVVVSANDFNKYLNTFEHPELEFIKEKQRSKAIPLFCWTIMLQLLPRTKKRWKRRQKRHMLN